MSLFRGIANLVAGESIAQSIINEGLSDALSTMESMPGNSGQESVYESYVKPSFIDTAQSTQAGDGWPGVDIGEYMDFMGEIVEAGNQIMEEAYAYAAAIEEDATADQEFDEDTGETIEG
jgi:hypothetical protein